MNDAFNDREKSFEAKYKMDEELTFKVEMRRNKLLGEWLADKFGMPSAEKIEYAKSVVIADLDEPGIEDVVSKVMSDISERGSDVSETEIRKKIEEFETIASEQLRNDFPDPLGKDHQKVGD